MKHRVLVLFIVGLLVSTISMFYITMDYDLDGKDDVPRTCYIKNRGKYV